MAVVLPYVYQAVAALAVSLISSAATTIRGPRIGEISQQTSQEGVPRPIVFGLSQPMQGNIIATSEPNVVRRKQRGGKGGPKVETESVYRTYAVGVGEGPISGFVRVWRNGILVYNARDGATAENAKFLETARFFMGGWDQLPSPDLEAIFGVGYTPAHRGTAYMVMANDDLTDMRGAIPQYVFQVLRCEGYYLTSRPYAVEDIEPMESFGRPRNSAFYQVDEGIESSAIPTVAELRAILHPYTDGAPEAIESQGTILSPNELRAILRTYTDWPPEAVESQGTILGGTLAVALVWYTNYPPEAVESQGTILSGTLT